jgi:uncharacterized protein (DUF2267 family)
MNCEGSMTYEEFLEVVQNRANTRDDRETLIAIEATLKTLGERLTDLQAARLASQLPFEVGLFLTVVDTNKDYDLDSFYRHVALREGLPLEESIGHALAVMSVLEETLEPGELYGALARLPEDYKRLFR